LILFHFTKTQLFWKCLGLCKVSLIYGVYASYSKTKTFSPVKRPLLLIPPVILEMGQKASQNPLSSSARNKCWSGPVRLVSAGLLAVLVLQCAGKWLPGLSAHIKLHHEHLRLWTQPVPNADGKRGSVMDGLGYSTLQQHLINNACLVWLMILEKPIMNL